MTATPCRECGHPLEPGVGGCSHCGASRPGRRTSQVLRWLGGLWTLIGVANFVGSCRLHPASPTFVALALIVNGLIFVFPGLVVYGLGALLATRS